MTEATKSSADYVQDLIRKAAESEHSSNAQQFAQAAQNAANALCALKTVTEGK